MSASNRAFVSDSGPAAVRAVQVAPPSIVYSHLPTVRSAPVIATPFGSPTSGSVTWATSVLIGAGTGVVFFGIGILIGGSIGVNVVSITGRSGAAPTVTMNVSVNVLAPPPLSVTVTVTVDTPLAFATGVNVRFRSAACERHRWRRTGVIARRA